MATRSYGWVSEVSAVWRKDLRAEFRTKYAINALIMFAVTTLTVVSFSIGPYAIAREVMAALLWIILFFSAMSGLSRAFIHEEETRTVNALRLSARPSVVLVGKLAFNISLLIMLEAVVVPLFLILMNLQIGNYSLFLLVLGLGTMGLAGATTIIAAIIAKASSKGALFAVLSFPILLPLLVMAINGTKLAINGAPVAEGLPEVRMLISYTVVMVTASLMLFEFVWNE